MMEGEKVWHQARGQGQGGVWEVEIRGGDGGKEEENGGYGVTRMQLRTLFFPPLENGSKEGKKRRKNALKYKQNGWRRHPRRELKQLFVPPEYALFKVGAPLKRHRTFQLRYNKANRSSPLLQSKGAVNKSKDRANR